ncbi:MAG: enoyl-CoA hydratase/isomerase family protein [Chloroflexi bacterium]|nr:enoyl-CoA hydratase/isomerase family protein [Chloroflexota bacterium]
MDTGNFRGFKIELENPGIAVITFNEPDHLNPMTIGMKRDLVETMTQAQLDDRVRVVLITGEGRAFCSGDGGPYLGGGGPDGPRQERTALAPPLRDPWRPQEGKRISAIGTYDALRSLSQSVNLAIRALDKLSIAAINGITVQTGLSLALSCDFRIASATARLSSATLRFALQPDEGGHYLLVQLIGVARTMEFLMRKRVVSGEEALELGIVHEAVEPDRLMARAMEFARELANGPQVAMRLLKRSIYNAAEMGMAEAFDDIATKTAISDHHPDSREGIAAFREKRAPRFNQWLEEQSGTPE